MIKLPPKKGCVS